MRKRSFNWLLGIACFSILLFHACNTAKISGLKSDKPLRLITLDPGHFHAALIQKSMLVGVDSTVHVYAPEGKEVNAHLFLIEGYNNREEHPTSWKEKVYLGDDYLEKMLAEKAGDIVVLAGNNQKKTNYIHQSITNGLNVLADKPMAITTEDFNLLKQAFSEAKENKLLIYDIMTERYEINTMLQMELAQDLDLFGELEKGSAENPAITKKSVHHYYKEVSGSPLKRPLWYYDVEQAGEGIVDVTTHYIDLVQWQLFPEQTIDYENDIEILSAKRWPTKISKKQYEKSTGKNEFPDYLKKDLKGDELHVFANGEMSYRIKGVHVRIGVEWNFEAPTGAGDTQLSIMRGTKANLAIRQGVKQAYQAKLYIEPHGESFSLEQKEAIKKAMKRIEKKYTGLKLEQQGPDFEVVIPSKYKEGHETHFSKVAQKYLSYVKRSEMPEWEIQNMLAKYYTTTQARELAMKNNKE